MPCNECLKFASQERLYSLYRNTDLIARFCSLNCCMVWTANHSAPTEVR